MKNPCTLGQKEPQSTLTGYIGTIYKVSRAKLEYKVIEPGPFYWPGRKVALSRDFTLTLLTPKTCETMPSETKLAEVKCPEAAVLADVYSIVDDLTIASFLSNQVMEAAKTNSHATPIAEAMACAAIIRYFRCFGGGARVGLRPAHLDELQPANRENHEYLKDLRDKYIAHSVNPFEECYVTTPLTVTNGVKQPITSVSAGSHRIVPSARESAKLFALIAEMLEIVRRRVGEEEKKLLAHLQSLPLEVVHGWDLHNPGQFKDADVSKSRPQTKHPKQ